MRKTIYIAMVGLAHSASLQCAVDQNPVDSLQEDSTCVKFVERVERKQFGLAHNSWIEGEVAHCKSPEFQWAQATVLAAEGNLDQALEAASKLKQGYSGDLRFEHLFLRVQSLIDRPPEAFFADMNPYPNALKGTDLLIAWVADDGPVILAAKAPGKRMFPNILHGHCRYALTEVAEDRASASAVAHLVSWRNVDIGPMTPLGEGKMLVSAVERGGLGLRRQRAALFVYDPEDPHKPKRAPFCKRRYHYTHPTFDAKAGEVIFSSDAAGGQGGMDLWRIAYDGDWGEMENLGATVNTPHNELYPQVAGDTLIFASNRPDMGYGGVDTYWYHAESGTMNFFGSPINTPFDDFNFMWTPHGKGYMVSNRAGSARTDRIYGFEWEGKGLYFESLIGRIKTANLGVDRSVHLLNSVGDTLQTDYLDSDGRFGFDVVRGMRSYEIALGQAAEEKEPVQLELMDEEGNVFKRVKGEAGRSFKFELLTPEDYYLERMEVDDQITLDADIIGRYLSGSDKKVKGRRIVLQDASGNDIAESLVGEDGAFRFRSVKADSSYIITVDDLDPNAVIHITDARGKLIKTIEPGEGGDFMYIRIDEHVKTIILTNEMKESISVIEGDVIELPDIYFDLNSARIQPSSEASLARLLSFMEQNPNIRVELGGHTDSRGAASYNLQLSQKRINAVVAYLLDRGVAANRVSGKGFGESQLVNDCSDGVVCTEEEHAANRRIEFSIFEIDP